MPGSKERAASLSLHSPWDTALISTVLGIFSSRAHPALLLLTWDLNKVFTRVDFPRPLWPEVKGRRIKVGAPYRKKVSRHKASLLWRTYYHDIEVKTRLHGLLPHLLNDGVDTNVSQQSGSPAGAVGATMTMTAAVWCSVTSSVTNAVSYAMTHAVTATMARTMTSNGNWNGARWGSRDAASSDTQALGWEGARRRRSPHVWGFGRDSWFGSNLWRNNVWHVYRKGRKMKISHTEKMTRK